MTKTRKSPRLWNRNSGVNHPRVHNTGNDSKLEFRLAYNEEEAIRVAQRTKARTARDAYYQREAARPKPSMPKFSWDK